MPVNRLAPDSCPQNVCQRKMGLERGIREEEGRSKEEDRLRMNRKFSPHEGVLGHEEPRVEDSVS